MEWHKILMAPSSSHVLPCLLPTLSYFFLTLGLIISYLRSYTNLRSHVHSVCFDAPTFSYFLAARSYLAALNSAFLLLLLGGILDLLVVV